MSTPRIKYNNLIIAVDKFNSKEKITIEFVKSITRDILSLSHKLQFYHKVFSSLLLKLPKTKPKKFEPTVIPYLNSEIRKTIILLENESIKDALTGLLNKKGFEERLKLITSRFDREATSLSTKGLALILIDLNKFKKVNDTYGHKVGDDLLIFCAQALNESTRIIDVKARVGGDEFCLILDSLEYALRETVLQVLVGKVNLLLSSKFKKKYPNKHINVSISAGLAMYNKDSHDINQVLQLADKAMYQAKNDKKKLLKSCVYKK
jgi:diguanylate cyclase (GGDEF)-like protein